MKMKKMVEIFKKGNIVLPLHLFQERDKFNLDMECFVFLMYLYNLGEKVLFDVNKFSNDLNIKVPSILAYIDELTEKKYITVDVIKNDKNVMEEYVVLDLFYDKLANMLVDDINNDEGIEEKKSIYDIIQEEFGKPISPIESEILDAWIESGVSEELILEAVKEAVLNGVANFRYIDKILYEWGKKGIKTKLDVENNRKNFKENQSKKEKLDLFDYNWLDDTMDDDE